MPSNDPVGEFFRDVFGSSGTSSASGGRRRSEQSGEEGARFTPWVAVVLVLAVVVWWMPILLVSAPVAELGPRASLWSQWLIDFRPRLAVAVALVGAGDLIRFLRHRQRRILSAVVRQTTGHNPVRIRLSVRTGWHSTAWAAIRLPQGSVVDATRQERLNSAVNALIVGSPLWHRVRAALPALAPTRPLRLLLRKTPAQIDRVPAGEPAPDSNSPSTSKADQ
ncbi:hypothetical protein L1080_035300 [Rhodococcus sp. MSC1_016]|jgi:hypothetical protein|uniref:hypothetical protein n=1 Tax=Rhodococcus sp. MSC1_016 TaxID=2909266 RepID=UPI00202EBD79|nr:hypothetical protein [Rhodococcus sp. MSC1_016]